MHPQPGVDDGVDAAKLPRAEVLSGEGHDRNADGVGNGPVKPVEFPVDRPGRRRIRAEQIDGLLNDDVCNAVHDGGKARGQADGRHAAQKRAVKPQFRQVQTAVARNAQQHPDHQPGANQLRQAGRHGCACRPETENSHEQKIQSCVGKRANDEEVERALGIAHCAQNASAHVIDHGGNHTGKIPLQIDNGIGQRVGGRVEQDEYRPGHPNAQRCHNGADHDGE